MRSSSSNDDKLKYLKMRTSFKLPKIFCEYIRNSKRKNAKENGVSRINKVLEIDKFLKQ